jgi:hypothetical protein
MSRSHPDYQKERKLQRELAFEQYVCDRAMFSSMIIFTG